MPIRGPIAAPVVALAVTLSLTGTMTGTMTSAAVAQEKAAGTPARAIQPVSAEEVEAVAFRKLQAELMVATLSCKDDRMRAHYNAFIKRSRAELRETAQVLKALFRRQLGPKAQRSLDAYMTGLANKASLESMGDPEFCTKAAARLEALAKGDRGQTAENR